MQVRLANLFSAHFPKLILGDPVPAEHLSRDPVVVNCYINDPLNWHGAMRARLASEVLRMLGEVNQVATALSTPFLILHGEHDMLCPVSGARNFYERLATKASEKKLVTYPGMYHEIFNEPLEQDSATKVNTPIRDVVAFFAQYIS